MAAQRQGLHDLILMDDHLAKPFEMRDLATTLERACEARGAQARTELNTPALDETLHVSMRTQFGAPFMSRLDSTFLRTATPLVDALRQALAQGDAAALRQAAHSLKSSSANVGARAFSALCTDLEHHGRDGQMTSAARLGAALDHAWQSVQEALAPTPPC